MAQMFDNLFDFDLGKPLTPGNFLLVDIEFNFNTVESEDGKKYNFSIKGNTEDGRPWNDTIFPNPIKNSKGEVVGNGFSIFLRNVQRQIAPDEDWTPPKTKAKFDEWMTGIKSKIEAAKLAVSVVQRDYRDKSTHSLRSTLNKNYYHTASFDTTDNLTF